MSSLTLPTAQVALERISFSGFNISEPNDEGNQAVADLKDQATDGIDSMRSQKEVDFS